MKRSPKPTPAHSASGERVRTLIGQGLSHQIQESDDTRTRLSAAVGTPIQLPWAHRGSSYSNQPHQIHSFPDGFRT